MKSTDPSKLETILRLIAHLNRRLSGISERAFLSDVDEIDLTAFRLSAIGEVGFKLSEDFKNRHPEVDWLAMYGMRNVIVHDYDTIRPEMLWDAAINHLAGLAKLCRTELSRNN